MVSTSLLTKMEENNKIIIFQEKNIRRVFVEGEWYYSIVDIVAVLTDSKDPADYWTTLKRRDVQLPTICRRFKLAAADGKNRFTDCADTEGLFRIIMSIPSAKAEPFKLWLAQVGKERIDEIENPELAAERARSYYKALGYDEAWIEMRLKTIEVRGQLTDEWKGRGVQEGREYAILTAEISKATFGISPVEYKDLKYLKKENLRDHMTNLELIFTMLGEETTRQKTLDMDAQGFSENQQAALEGGLSAGKALDAFEQQSGVKVVTANNFKGQIAAAKQKDIE
jgi:DNA-damage-inducible protein D